MRIINDFEDVLTEKERGRSEQYEQEAAGEIIEEEERNVEADDLKVEPEDGESHERAEFQTQEKDAQNLKRAFKEEAGKYLLKV